MKYNAIQIVKPKGFDVTTIGDYNKRHKEKYQWLLHTIIFKQLTSKESFNGYVNLSKELLVKYLGEHYYKGIINTLSDNGIIEANNSYSNNPESPFCKSYRMNPAVLGKGIEADEISKKTYCRKIYQYQKDNLEQIFKDNPNIKREFFWLSYRKIKIKEAVAYVNANYIQGTKPYEARILSIQEFAKMSKIRNKNIDTIDFLFKYVKGRLYTPATMLPRDLEQFTYFIGQEGKRSVSLDMPNSQLCFFNQYAKNEAVTTYGSVSSTQLATHREYSVNIDDICIINECSHHEIENKEGQTTIKLQSNIPFTPMCCNYSVSGSISADWSSIIFNGKGYECMMFLMKYKNKEANHTKEERQQFKSKFFGELFYNQYKDELTKMEQVFMTYFPAEAVALRTIKKKLGNSMLAVNVQKLEARLFHKLIVDLMHAKFKHVPFTIKHDSITIPEAYVNQVKNDLDRIVQMFFRRNDINLKAELL